MSQSAPSIVIYLAEGLNGTRVLREVLKGVEEESIPVEIVSSTTDNAVSLAYQGAQQSGLEVGIGIDRKNNLAVHYRKLPPENPLFLLDYTKSFEEVKSTSANAARLVKNTPFLETKNARHERPR